MFAENALFWLAIRRALLDIVNALESGLRDAGALDGPTTSEIRQWWKKQKHAGIPVELPKETIIELEKVSE